MPGTVEVLASRRWGVLIAIAVGSLMAGLDSSVSNAVLPVVATNLHANVSSTQWVVLVYLLVTGALALAAGRVGDMHGHRRAYIGGFVLFVVSSAACAFAPSLGCLVAARGCQATGAALLVSNAPAILTGAFPDRQRGRVLSLQATALYIGLAIGPSVGGLLTLGFGWGTVFLINVPIGLIGIVLARHLIPSDEVRSTSRQRFDVPGTGTFATGLALLILGVNQAHVCGGWIAAACGMRWSGGPVFCWLSSGSSCAHPRRC
jgi:MFS family permease